MEKLNIHIFSDSFGESGEQVVKCALSQFELESSNYNLIKHRHVSDLKTLDREFRKISDYSNVFMLFTLVNLEVVEKAKHFCEMHNIQYADLLNPLLNALKIKIGKKPKRESGKFRVLDQEYFNRVDAIEFAVKFDDGKDSRMLNDADLVLIGISRTSKTPLSIYLANKVHIKVLNIPLVPEVEPPKELYDISKKRIIGLTNSVEMLNKIRKERIKCIGLKNGSNYSSLGRIIEELEYAERIMRKIGCPIIDVSDKAIEETAQIIVEIMKEQGVL
ncbi:pyruvate, water dikinase regulatory protein [Fusobacterium sp. IOR10]|uniref:pyruvate, water dikinase regulatory protein n=1 Tax=Fusobacterium sp. IOR10 TaxID=2665157 RepID=UPI0013CFCDB5|nr:pyruvate, water dikinase regulatory protein [Fusobacterium sp. IOR10]